MVGTAATQSHDRSSCSSTVSVGDVGVPENFRGPQNSYGTGVAVDSGGYVYVTGYTYSLGPNTGNISGHLAEVATKLATCCSRKPGEAQ